MKISNNQELQETAFNQSSDIDFYESLQKKKVTARPYYFSVIDNTLASDNPLYFRKNL